MSQPRIFRIALFSTAVVTAVGRAQTIVQGTVTEKGRDTPIVAALVSALHMRSLVTTGRFGRFAIRLQLPDTLVVAAIGYTPDTIVVQDVSMPRLKVELTRSPLLLSDIIVAAPEATAAQLATLGQWTAPREAMHAVPFAVETDVFRSLSLVPAVSFSTPLSARPIIRGYDPAATTVRLDGFEVVNLFHLARAFASFPAEGAERISVMAAPQGSDVGGTLAGVIDITGRSAESSVLHGGGELSLGSLTGWLMDGGSPSWFAVGRVATLSFANALVAGDILPYTFADLYGKLLLPKGGEISVFGSRDRLGSRSDGSGADWGSGLVGWRLPLYSRGKLLVDGAVSVSRFNLDVDSLQTGASTNDVRNRFGRIAASLDLSQRSPIARVDLGLALGFRFIKNRIEDRTGRTKAGANLNLDRPEPSGYLQLSRSLGPLAAEAGVRLDGAGSVWLLQPRFRIAFESSHRVSMGVAIGRTARLFQLVSDPLSEPDLDFVEYWLGADGRNVPVPVIDHASAELTATRAFLHVRISGFASRGRGIAELQPENGFSVLDTTEFRFGRSRTMGAEVQVAIRGTSTRASSLSLTYVLGSSKRDFGEGWRAWRLDRRHVVRVMGQIRLTNRATLMGASEWSSGMPFTPASAVIYLQRPERPEPSAVFLLGEENSGRGGGTLRTDVAARFAFGGPGRSTMAFGVSVTNLGFGPVAPMVLEGGRGPRITYKRLFDLPAIPTVTLRIDF